MKLTLGENISEIFKEVKCGAHENILEKKSFFPTLDGSGVQYDEEEEGKKRRDFARVFGSTYNILIG